jgi:phenylacetate-CoA ligase
VHGLAVIYPIRDIPGIAAFKVIQHTKEQMTVQIVPGAVCGSEVEATITAGIKARLGEMVNVTVERVADIPRENSGKFRYIVSHVQINE